MRCICLSILALLPSVAIARTTRLNVLLITADDLGMQLGCYGDSTVPTPNLDRLASTSAQFDRAYVAQASCSPSRSAMLTGTYPHTNGHYGLANAGVGFEVPERALKASIPNRLKSHGYRTGIIGKLHVNSESGFRFDFAETKDGFGNRDVRRQVEFAEQFWKSGDQTPWFLMFNVFDPHVIGSKARKPGQGAFPDVVDGIPTDPIAPGDVSVFPWQGIDTPVMRRRTAGYYNCVQRVDAAVGMLMKALDQTGARDQTLIIFLGDHGPPFSRGKTTCYEAGLRVPMLMSWPGVSTAHRSDQLVSAIDIAPTVFDAVGLPPVDVTQGQSLRNVARPNSPRLRDAVVSEFHFHGSASFHPTRAITDGRFKLIRRLPGHVGRPIVSIDGDPSARELASLGDDHPSVKAYARLVDPPAVELYDLQTDPHEFDNLAGRAEFAAQQKSLEESLRAWQQNTNDPFVDPEFRDSVAERYCKAKSSEKKVQSNRKR